jgi:hypothetical protein
MPRSLDEIFSDAPQSSGTGRSLDQIFGGAPSPVAPPPIAGKPKLSRDIAPLQRLEAFGQWAENTPVAHGINTALNASVNLGLATILGRNPIPAMLDPAHTIDLTHEAEKFEGWPTPSNPWLSVPEDFFFETINDPGTVVPGANVFNIGARALKYGGKLAGPLSKAVEPIAQKAAPVVNAAGKGLDATLGFVEPKLQKLFKLEAAPSEKPSVAIKKAVTALPGYLGAAKNRALGSIVEGYNLRKGVTRQGEDIVKGHEIAALNRRKAAENMYTELVERNRPALEAWEAERDRLKGEIGRNLAQIPPRMRKRIEQGALTPGLLREWPQGRLEKLDADRAVLEQQLKAHDQTFPPEIRQATLQRAYHEGTPRVRALALSKGYVPTQEERNLSVLNVLHQFREAYEPTHDIYPVDKSDEFNRIAQSKGPIYYLSQGKKKAKFDLPGKNLDPNMPLADRLRDRFARGVRIEEYYRPRHDILRDTGLLPAPDIGRTGERLEQAATERNEALPLLEPALQTGDPRLIAALVGRIGQNEKRTLRYGALQKLQEQSEERAAALREQTLKKTPQKGETLEFLEPFMENRPKATALRRAARELNIEEHGFGVPVKPPTGAHRLNTSVLRTRFQGGKKTVTNVERLSELMRQSAQKTQKAAQDVTAQQTARFSKALQGIQKATGEQGARVSKLGNALENHQLVRAGYRSDIPKLRDDVLQLQAAYLAAKRLASTAYKSGLGKNVDDELHRIAAHRLDHPAGTNLTVVDREGLEPIVKGGKSVGFTPYSQDEISRVLSALRKSKAKVQAPPTRADAIRHLDESMNAIGAARQNVEEVARRYDISTRGMSPEGISQSIKEMGDAFRSSLGYVQGQMKKTPPVPKEIKGGIKSVVRGHEKLAGAVTKANAPQVGKASFQRVLNPSQHAAVEGKASLAKVIKSTQQTANKLESAEAAKAADKEVVSYAQELADRMNRVEMPEALQERLFADKPEYRKSMFRLFTDLQREALFILPFAHMKNVTLLALLGPNGWPTVKRGWAYYRQLRDARRAKTLSALEPKIQELVNTGATTLYFRDPAHQAPWGWVGKWSSDALDDYDLAMRVSLADTLKEQGMTGFQMAGQVRDILGDYHNQAPLIRELRDRAGAAFPAWRLGIVPQAMTKAIREQPGSAKLYARANQVISDDVTDPTMKTGLNIAAPLEDYGELVADPLKYVASPSSSGVVGIVPGALLAKQSGRIMDFAEQEGQRLFPGGSALGGFTHFPFPTNAPSALSGAAGLLGIYFPDQQRKQRERQLIKLGIPHAERIRILKSEGYLKPLAPPPIPEQSGAGAIDWSKP